MSPGFRLTSSPTCLRGRSSVGALVILQSTPSQMPESPWWFFPNQEDHIAAGDPATLAKAALMAISRTSFRSFAQCNRRTLVVEFLAFSLLILGRLGLRSSSGGALRLRLPDNSRRRFWLTNGFLSLLFREIIAMMQKSAYRCFRKTIEQVGRFGIRSVTDIIRYATAIH